MAETPESKPTRIYPIKVDDNLEWSKQKNLVKVQEDLAKLHSKEKKDAYLRAILRDVWDDMEFGFVEEKTATLCIKLLSRPARQQFRADAENSGDYEVMDLIDWQNCQEDGTEFKTNW